MILPVIVNDGQTPPPADALTTRLAALSELVILLPSGGGAGAVAGFKGFLGEFGCRVGPFDVLEGDKDAKASKRELQLLLEEVGMYVQRRGLAMLLAAAAMYASAMLCIVECLGVERLQRSINRYSNVS